MRSIKDYADAEALDYVSGKRDSELAFYDVWGQDQSERAGA